MWADVFFENMYRYISYNEEFKTLANALVAHAQREMGNVNEQPMFTGTERLDVPINSLHKITVDRYAVALGTEILEREPEDRREITLYPSITGEFNKDTWGTYSLTPHKKIIVFGVGKPFGMTPASQIRFTVEPEEPPIRMKGILHTVALKLQW